MHDVKAAYIRPKPTDQPRRHFIEIDPFSLVNANYSRRGRWQICALKASAWPIIIGRQCGYLVPGRCERALNHLDGIAWSAVNGRDGWYDVENIQADTARSDLKVAQDWSTRLLA